MKQISELINKVHNADCLELLKEIPDNSIDAIITDPPYGLGFMGKEWDTFKDVEKKSIPIKQRDTSCGRIVGRNSPALIAGSYDFRRNVEFQKQFIPYFQEMLRVAKPGATLLSFGGTRTYHRMACAIEDAGFEVRDCIMWLYGSGFPKSLNIGKQIDKIQGNERIKTGEMESAGFIRKGRTDEEVFLGGKPIISTREVTKGNSEWEGWGTALKPACEPIILARKPLSEKNVALNVLKWGTGGINIDECRIEFDLDNEDTRRIKGGHKTSYIGGELIKNYGIENQENRLNGRFPANIILDEEAGKMLDEQTEGKVGNGHWAKTKVTGFGKFGNGKSEYMGVGEKDKSKGGASRFFYCAKASKSERNFGLDDFEDRQKCPMSKESRIGECINASKGMERFETICKNNHPTVKPIKLIKYLIKLVSKEGAIILDPFLGSGTTAVACKQLNRNFIGIEKEKEYCDIANARIKPFLEQQKLK